MASFANFNVMWACAFLCGTMGLLCEIPGVSSFVLLGARTKMNSCQLTRKVHTGDDFAGYEDAQSSWEGEGQALAQDFYRELQIRQDLAAAMAKADEASDFPHTSNQVAKNPLVADMGPQSSNQNPRAMQSAGFFNNNRRTRVYINGRSRRQSKNVPVPPKPTFRSPTRLSISSIIAVVLLSRYFWVQALVSAGLIAAYLLLVAACESSGGGGWLGASLGSHVDWSSSVNDGVPLMEQTTTAGISDGESSANL